MWLVRWKFNEDWTWKMLNYKEWRELNARWYQFGAFCPLFRAHGQYPYREVWNIAPAGHPCYNSIVYYTKLRYNMMPYIYSLAGMTYFNDYTIMRPLVMDFTADANVNNIGDSLCSVLPDGGSGLRIRCTQPRGLFPGKLRLV